MDLRWAFLALVGTCLVQVLTASDDTDQSLSRQERGAGKRRGKNNRERPCLYDRERSGTCEDENGEITLTMTLKPDQPETCMKTKTKTIPCSAIKNRRANRKDNRRGGGGRRRGRQEKEVTDENGCTYIKDKGAKQERQNCEAGETRTITWNLKPGSPATCPETKTDTKPCKAGAGGKKGNNNDKRGRNSNKRNRNRRKKNRRNDKDSTQEVQP